MNAPLVLVCLWIVVAAAGSAVLSARASWRFAYGLIAVGAPLLGYVYWRDGAFWAALALIAGALVLRWPLIYLARWLRARLGSGRG